MNVPANIQNRITEIVKEGLKKAEAYYKRSFAMPQIVYTKSGGRVAGTATFATNTINLNPAMLMQNVEDFIDRTPLHELAHLIDHAVNPQNHNRGIAFDFNRMRSRREKRDVHGPDWQHVARVCGMKDPTRCHSYDTTGLKRVTANSRQYQYACPCGCQKVYTVGLKIHNQLQANPDSRFHIKGIRLVYKGLKGENAPVVKPKGVVIVKTGFEGPGVTTVQKVGGFKDVTVVKSQDQAGSKIDQCWAIYKRNVGSSRAAIIQTMVSVANCTPAGAATYYATCKKRFESGVL